MPQLGWADLVPPLLSALFLEDSLGRDGCPYITFSKLALTRWVVVISSDLLQSISSFSCLSRHITSLESLRSSEKLCDVTARCLFGQFDS